MKTHTTASRVAALFAAIATTTLTVGSQLGIADNYTAEADGVLAARRGAPVAQNGSTNPPQARQIKPAIEG